MNFKKGVASKAVISLSLSTTNRTATDCTLPADSLPLTFLHNTSDNSKPTNLSSTLRACWALTRSRSHCTWFGNRLLDGRFCDFTENNSFGMPRVEVEHFILQNARIWPLLRGLHPLQAKLQMPFARVSQLLNHFGLLGRMM